MESQVIINIVIGSVLSVLGWFARQLWDAVQQLKSDMKELEVELPTHYIRKDEFEYRLDKIESMLERIFDKLDDKADK
jgi:hypothetical protein